MHVSQNISGFRKTSTNRKTDFSTQSQDTHKSKFLHKISKSRTIFKRDLELNIGSEGQHSYYHNSDRRSSVVGAAAASPLAGRDEVLY